MFWIMGGDKLALAILALIPASSAPWVEQAKLQFEHVKWEGFHFYDLIMPLFLFVVGAAMPFSFARRAELGHSNGRMLFKLLRRTVILFVLGMAVQGHLLDFNLETLHPFSNTLQAIAVGYLFSGIFMLFLPVWGQIAAAIFLMLLYWGLLMFIPVPVEGQEAARGVLQEHANIAYIGGEVGDGPLYRRYRSAVHVGPIRHYVHCDDAARRLRRLHTSRRLYADDEIRLADAARRRLPRRLAGPGPNTCTSRSSSTSGPAQWSCGPPVGAICCSPCSIW